MRPDKRKKNRGRNSEKSEGTAQEKKVEENVDSRSENVSSIQKETEKTDLSKPVKVEETAEKVKNEAPPILNLKRETDELKETKKFSKRQIFSNWDKYDEPIVPEEEDEIHDDFGSLIQRNFSGDEHFKFKFQQQWEKESHGINQDLFTLNLEQLSSGLSCIPFYKRLNLPMELFSESELQEMEDDAKTKEKDYENTLKGERAEPVTTSLLGKLKECLDVKVTNATVKNPYENDEVTLPGIGESTAEDYAISEDAVWGVDVSQKEIQPVRDVEASSRVWEEKIVQSDSKIEMKEEININQATEVKEIEEKEVLSFDPPERIEVEKEQRKKRPSNRRREAANRSSNKTDQSNNLPINTTEVKSTVNDNAASKEEIPKKQEPEKVLEVTPPQEEIKNVLPKKEPKIETPVCDKKAPGSSLPLKKPAAPVSTKKDRVEVDEELDSLLSLKEPSLPQYNLSHKAQEDEHEMENLVTNVSSIVIHEKKENLEEWLDSMLDD